MTVFKQNNNFLLGAPDDIEELANASEARILVISDSHRAEAVFKKILEEFGPSCDALIFCGDGAYDLASVLNKDFNNDETERFVPPVAAFVRGNGDLSEVVTEFDPVPQKLFPNPHDIPFHLKIPPFQFLEAAGKKIFISHGHIQGIDYDQSIIMRAAEENQCQIILHGHTHIPRSLYTEGIHLFCPGSISLPRGGTEKSFCVLTIKGSYVDAAFKKITPTGFESFTPAGL